MPADDVALVPDDDDEDDCLCGLDHLENDTTTDAELPPASGGVESAAANEAENEDDVDGCEVDFTTGALTSDKELPAATGGM
jgi:hypothetical protein